MSPGDCPVCKTALDPDGTCFSGCDVEPARQQARRRKPAPARRDGNREAPDAGKAARVVRLAAVKPERVDWLWPGYLPLGKVATLDGDPDLGKSVITLDIAARVSTGSPMPDGAEPVKGAVLILSAEDGLADTIRPRLDAAGGDPAQVITITDITDHDPDGKIINRPVELPRDLPQVGQVVSRGRVVLVVVDVLMAYLSGTVNSHRDQDVRRALHPLAVMAERTGCCVLVIRHLNKSGGQHAIYRGGGSIGIVGASRAAFMVGADPDDPAGQTRILAPVKTNLATRPPSLAYKLVPDDLRGCVRVDWLGVSERRAADLLAADDDEARDEKTAAGEAAEWLIGFLRDQGTEARSADIKKAARGAGIPERTLQRGRVKAKVRIRTSGFPPTTVWYLPDDYGELPSRPEQAPFVPTMPNPSNGAMARMEGLTRPANTESHHGQVTL
jgi:hypothetical protein